jgi:predicted HTH domain antitoxin
MPLILDYSERVESKLHAVFGDNLGQTMLESLLIEGYRSGKISVGQIADILGKTSVQADEFLAQRGVPLNYTVEDLQKDLRTLDQLLGP